MPTDPKTEPTNSEIVKALFERFGPREGNDGGHGRNIHYRLHLSPTPHYHSGQGSQYFEWSPLTNVADLAPAVLETLREPERAAHLNELLVPRLTLLECSGELTWLCIGLRLLANPETLPLVARSVVAAWGLLEENDD